MHKGLKMKSLAPFDEKTILDIGTNNDITLLSSYIREGADLRAYDNLLIRVSAHCCSFGVFTYLRSYGFTKDDLLGNKSEVLLCVAHQGDVALFAYLMTWGVTLEDLRRHHNAVFRAALVSGNLPMVQYLRHEGIDTLDLKQVISLKEVQDVVDLGGSNIRAYITSWVYGTDSWPAPGPVKVVETLPELYRKSMIGGQFTLKYGRMGALSSSR